MPHRTRVVMAVAHFVGGVAGGAVGAVAVWLVASPLRTILPLSAREGIVAAVALVAVLMELRILKVRGRQGQVDARWYRKFGPVRAYAAYGLMLGSAIATLRPFAFVYPVLAATGLLVPFPDAVLCGAVFGLGRTVLLGPASYRATFFSCVLHRHAYAFAAWRGVSTTASLFILGTMAGRAGGF
jgi:hypothetical protein